MTPDSNDGQVMSLGFQHVIVLLTSLDGRVWGQSRMREVISLVQRFSECSYFAPIAIPLL